MVFSHFFTFMFSPKENGFERKEEQSVYQNIWRNRMQCLHWHASGRYCEHFVLCGGLQFNAPLETVEKYLAVWHALAVSHARKICLCAWNTQCVGSSSDTDIIQFNLDFVSALCLKEMDSEIWRHICQKIFCTIRNRMKFLTNLM